MAETAELFVDISLKGNFGTGIAKAQKATRNFANETKKASGAVGGLGAKLKSVVSNPELKKSILTGAGLGAGLGGFQLLTKAISGTVAVMGDSIGLASDLAESQSKVDEVFGDSADEIHDWSVGLIQDFGLTERAAEEAAGTFGNFLQAMGTTREEALSMSRGIVELGADLAAFNNVSVDDVLVSLRAGIAGEAEPMRRLGADVSAARVETILLANGIEKINGRFTEGQKVLGRYEAIMQDTVTAQGNFAKTSGDLAGRQKILNAQLETLQTRLGALLTPVAGALIDFVSNLAAVVSGGEAATERVARLTEAMKDNAAATRGASDALAEYADKTAEYVNIAALEFSPLTRDFTDDLLSLAKQLGLTQVELDELIGRTGAAGGITTEVARNVEGLVEALRTERHELTGVTILTQAWTGATSEAADATEGAADATATLSDVMAGAVIGAGSTATALGAIATQAAKAKNRADRLADGLAHVAEVGFKEVRQSANEARKAIEAAFKGDDKNVKSVRTLQQERDKLQKQQRRAALQDRSHAFALATARLQEVKAQLQQRNRERRATKEFREELKGRKKGVEEVTTTVEDLGKEAAKEKRLQIKTDHAQQDLNAIHKTLKQIRAEAHRGVITLSVLKERAATIGIKPSAGPSFGGGSLFGGSTRQFSGGSTLLSAMRPAPPIVNVTNTISAYDVQGETSRVLATNRQVTP